MLRKEGKLQFIRQFHVAIDHEVHHKILKCQRANVILKCCHKMSNSEKKGLLLPKKGMFIFSCIYDPVYSRDTNRIVTKEQEATMYPEKTKQMI